MNDRFVTLHSMTRQSDESVRVDIDIEGDRFQDTIYLSNDEIQSLEDSGLLERLFNDNLDARATIVKLFGRVLAGDRIDFPMRFLPAREYRRLKGENP